jgi:RNA polymerase sigma-70 factor (ECF subfamily)
MAALLAPSRARMNVRAGAVQSDDDAMLVAATLAGQREAFLKAFRALTTFRRGSKFSTWIFSIAYHACCDRLNRRRRYSDAELPDRADPAPGPVLEAERLDEATRLRAAIDALPEKYRAVITLYHLQGHQYEEIARVLDLPMGTVKTHLFRAKEQLRRELAGLRTPAAEGVCE